MNNKEGWHIVFKLGGRCLVLGRQVCVLVRKAFGLRKGKITRMEDSCAFLSQRIYCTGVRRYRKQ